MQKEEMLYIVCIYELSAAPRVLGYNPFGSSGRIAKLV